MTIITEENLNELSSQIKNNSKKLFESVKGIQTGYPELDRFTKGLLPGHLICLGAETGIGKSVFATNILINIALIGKEKSLYLDLENGAMTSQKRFLMIAGEKDSEFFDNPANESKVAQIANLLADKIYYYDRTALDKYLNNKNSIEAAKALTPLIEDAIVKQGVKVIIIDPLKEFETISKDSVSTYIAITQVVAHFRDLAQKYNVTIILIHHLKKIQTDSQSVKNLNDEIVTKYRVPTLHDFMGSANIVGTATDVWAFVRQIQATTDYEKGITLFRILKARETRLADVHFQMDLETLRFSTTANYIIPPNISAASAQPSQLDDDGEELPQVRVVEE